MIPIKPHINHLPDAAAEEERARAGLLEKQIVLPSRLRRTPAPARRPKLSVLRLWRERSLQAVALTMIFLLGFLWWPQKTLTSRQYRIIREGWRQNADLVISGDSRAHVGLSPAAMQGHLPLRIVNFAFDALQYNPDHFAGLRRVLDRQSPQPAILFGITPLNFLAASRPDMAARISDYVWGHYPSLLEATLPLSYRLEGWSADGWTYDVPAINAARWQQNINHHTLTHIYLNNRFSPQRMDYFLGEIQALAREGVAIYGFQPPSTPQLIQYEKEHCGFNYGTFLPRFAAAGGVWLEVPQQLWETYDGVHLTREAALDFSGYLGRRLAELLAGHDNSAAAIALAGNNGD